MSTISDKINPFIEKATEYKHKADQWDQTVQNYIPGSDPKHTDFIQLQTVIAGIKSTATASNNKVAQDTITIAGLNKQIANFGEKLALADTQRQQDAEMYLSQIDALKTGSATNEKMVGSFRGQIRALQTQVKQALDDKHTLAVELAQCQVGTQQSLWDKFLSLFKGVSN